MNVEIGKLIGPLAQAPFTVALSGLALLLFSCPSLAPLLELQSAGGGWLNPLTCLGCHFLHWSAEHLFWDLGMFAVTGYLCERAGQRAFLCTLGIAAMAIPCLVAWYHPELRTYRGLSGLDTALFALFISRAWLQSARLSEPVQFWGCLGLWLAMFGKSLFELTTGQVLFVKAENFVPVPMAHLVGILCGSVVAFSKTNPTDRLPRGHRDLPLAPGCRNISSSKLGNTSVSLRSGA